MPEISALMPSYGTARNPIDVTAQGVTSGGLQKSVDVLTASDEIDAILIVLSLSSDVRKPFKEAELTPVLAAQHKPVVFYSYTVPSDFARRELAKSGVVVLSGLTYVGVAMRQLVDYATFELQRPADGAQVPARDISAQLKSPALSEADSKTLLRAAGIALPDQVLVKDKGGLDDAVTRVGFPLVLKIQSRTSRTRARSAACASISPQRAKFFWRSRRCSTTRASTGLRRPFKACWSARWRSRVSRSSL